MGLKPNTIDDKIFLGSGSGKSGKTHRYPRLAGALQILLFLRQKKPCLRLKPA